MSVQSLLFSVCLGLIVLRGSLDGVSSFQWGGLNPASWAGLFVIASGGAFFVAAFVKEKRSTRSPAHCSDARSGEGWHAVPEWIVLGWIGGLVLWVLVPLAMGATEWKWAAREWIRLAAVAVVFLAMFRGARLGEGRRVLCVLPWAMLIPTFVGLYQLLMGSGMQIKGFHRIYGTFSHPNPFGFHLTLMALVAWMGWKTMRRPWFWAIVLLTQLVLLLATASFTVLLMAATATGILVVLLIQKRFSAGERRKYWTVMGLVGMAVLVGVGVLMKDRIAYEFRPEEIERAFETGQMKSSFTWRLVTWWKYLQASVERPWFGHGLGSSAYLGPWPMPDGSPAQPHNDLVRWLFELGVAGTLWMLGLVIGLSVCLWRVWRTVTESTDTILLMISIAALAVAMVGALNDNVFIATAFLMEWAALWGTALGTAAYRKGKA